jgi:hypothetical protein
MGKSTNQKINNYAIAGELKASERHGLQPLYLSFFDPANRAEPVILRSIP